jgi:flagellar biosynthetic protein FlhB
MAGSDQKTEQATPRRVEKARKDGQFAVSHELLTAVHFAVALAIWNQYGTAFASLLSQVFRQMLAMGFESKDSAQTILEKAGGLTAAVWIGLAMGGAALGATAILTQMAQTGFRLAPTRLQPEWSRLNPVAKLSQMPAQNQAQVIRALLLIPVVGFILWGMIDRYWWAILSLPRQSPEAATGVVSGWFLSALWRAAAALILIGFIDLFRQRRRFAKQLKMSRQEIRDENKEVEGNPQVKAQIRRMQRDLVRKRMMTQVPKATVVVVNPTHYAVALRYLPDEGAAPQVLAKGRNYLAARIRTIAKEHQIPVVENPPLARALYKSVEVGQEIPAHLYRAVAEVLAYIFRLRRGFGRWGGHRG